MLVALPTLSRRRRQERRRQPGGVLVDSASLFVIFRRAMSPAAASTGLPQAAAEPLAPW